MVRVGKTRIGGNFEISMNTHAIILVMTIINAGTVTATANATTHFIATATSS